MENKMELKEQLEAQQKWMQWIREHVGNVTTAMINAGLDKETASRLLKDVVIYDSFENEKPRLDVSKNFIKLKDGEVRIVSKTNKPFICYLEDVLTSRQCDELIKISATKVQQSKVFNQQGEPDVSEFRTSSSTHFDRNESEFLKQVDDRLCEIINYKPEDTEPLQVLRYQAGQEYKPHTDYFHDSVLKKDKRNRVATLIVYLTDLDSGGTTSFPRVGSTFYPRKGSAIYFEYCNSKGELDESTLHSGDPVIEGEKWILTKWYRQIGVS